jgi:K+-sensing histidine kinase KdpD
MGVVDGIREYCREARATQIVVGKSPRSWWFELRHGSVVDHLVRTIGEVAVHVMPASDEPARGRRRARAPGVWGRPSHYLWTLAVVAGLTALGRGLVRAIDLGNIALLRIAGELGLIDAALGTEVGGAYRAMRKLQHQLRLQGQEARVEHGLVARHADAVVRLWGALFGT